ncbi:hypothetical protein [Citrobacter amalonaticus]|uniref:hypothetical protein n=1 Tax=Citrobacter amalonaticus TaxID=35703 RepID=UPI001240EB2D|nr:hypothetical protein [Citrobacter amalonaticus]
MPTSTFEVVDFISKAGVGVITGAVAAAITAKFALNRFYREKWWEKKHAAYNQLIDNLFELHLLHRKVIVSIRLERYLGEVEQEKDRVKERWNELEIAIKRALVLSPITLSEKTKEQIQKYLNEISSRDFRLYKNKERMDKVYSQDAKVLDDVIATITQDAKEELKFK